MWLGTNGMLRVVVLNASDRTRATPSTLSRPQRSCAMHAGDVTPTAAFESLRDDPTAVLVDVRTRAEWMYVGIPELSGLGKRPLLVEWQGLDGAINPTFVDTLRSAGVPEDAPIFFLCRSGARSAGAASAATAAGFGRAYNVAHGFEGPPDGERHRGGIAGWKAEGLPWTQT